jgi:hypothetical protein
MKRIGNLKKSLFFLCAISTIFTSDAVSADQWSMSDLMYSMLPGHHFVVVEQDAEEMPLPYSYLKAVRRAGSSQKLGVFCFEGMTCSNLNASNGFDVEGNLIFPVCKTKTQTYCIEKVEIRSAGSKGSANFSGYFDPHVPGVGDWNRFHGSDFGTSSIWENKSSDSEAESPLYLVTAGLVFNSGPYDALEPKLTVQVQPVLMQRYANYMPTVELSEDGTSLRNRSFGSVFPGMFRSTKCAWTETETCAVKQDLKLDDSIEIGVRLPRNDFKPLIFSRVSRPEIKFSKIANNNVSLTVSGNPIKVPQLFASIPDSQFPAAIPNPGSPVNLGISEWGVENGNKVLDALRPFVRDRATSEIVEWQYSSMYQYSSSSDPKFAFWKSKRMQSCIAQSPGLVATISSNAMLAGDGPPEYDGKSLINVVAGMHYASNGDVAEGTYSLILSRTFANCLYSFSTAPIFASVSVIGASGESKTAVTSVSVKGEWLHFNASGFTFSSNKIRTKLVQPKRK